MPGYIATIQVTREYHIPVKAKDEDAAYEKVQSLIDNDTWEKYAAKVDDDEPDVSLVEVGGVDPDIDEFERWVR